MEGYLPLIGGGILLTPGILLAVGPRAANDRPGGVTPASSPGEPCAPLTVPCLGLATGERMQGGVAERSRPIRQSFAELLSAKLVSLETDFGLEPKFGLHVVAGQVEISLKSARAASGHATADDAPALNVPQGAVPPRLQEAEAMRLQRAFGINREYALRLLRERAIGRRSTSAGRQVRTHTHRRLPVDYHCLEVQDAVETQSEEPGQPTRANELLTRGCQKWALRTAWRTWCRWAAAKAKTAAASDWRLQCSRLRSNSVATSFKAWRARLSLTAEARRLTSDTRRGKRAMRWAWQHLVRSSVSRGLRIVPLQVAWRIWRTTAVAEATKAGSWRRCQMYAALHAWQQRAARTKAVRDRPRPLKLASRPTAACDEARWLLLRRAWAQWTSPCIGSAKADATLVKHALNKLKVSKLRLAWSIWLHPQVRFAEDPLARGTHIFVKGVTSRQLQLFTSLSTPADVVSRALAQRVNGPAPMLKSGCHYLNGARPLSSYHVRSGDTIETSLGLRGGMDPMSTGASASAAGAGEDDASLHSPAGSASGLSSRPAQRLLDALERIDRSGQPVTKQDVHGYKVTYRPQIIGENGARLKQKTWSIKPPGSFTPIRSIIKLKEHLGVASPPSLLLEQQQQQTQVPKLSPLDVQRQESSRDALVICHADDYAKIKEKVGNLFATRMQASEERELLNLIATKLTMRGAATDASYAGFYESLKPPIEDMIDAATDEYKTAVDFRNTMQQSFQSNPRLEQLVWNTLSQKKYLDDLKAPPPEVDSITLEEARQSSSWPAADTAERAVRRILADGEAIGVVVICKLPTPDDDEDTVLDDDPPPPVRVKANWNIKGERFSVELDGIFGLPPMNDDALSTAIDALFASLQKAFEDVDQAEPRPFTEGCKIKSCSIHHAKNTDGIRLRIKPTIILSQKGENTGTHEPTYDSYLTEMIRNFKNAFRDGQLEGKPLAELDVEIEGDASPTPPASDKGQTIPRADAPVIFPKQREVGDRIFARAQEVLGTDAWSSFTAVEFLVVTANFTTIREQTMERLSEHGLLPDSEDGQKKVVFTYLKSKDSLTAYEEFRNRALSNASTLFIVVADECHWGITRDGSARISPKPTPKFLAV